MNERIAHAVDAKESAVAIRVTTVVEIVGCATIRLSQKAIKANRLLFDLDTQPAGSKDQDEQLRDNYPHKSDQLLREGPVILTTPTGRVNESLTGQLGWLRFLSCDDAPPARHEESPGRAALSCRCEPTANVR
jgi:hypothetical protein